ncbi:hypothetical protein ABFA07_002852 [Porites harrisoni]
MKSSMMLFAALVLCALPSALGSVMCYQCMPDMATGSLCNMMSQYTKIMCKNENSTCYNSTITTSIGKSYVLGCVDLPTTCDQTNSSVCQNATDVAMPLNVTIHMCMTSCPGNLSNIPPEAMITPTPTSTMTTMMTTSVTAAPPTTAAAEKLCPKFLGVLFIILFTILRQ